MGTYNTIITTLTCPNCHVSLEWQSKELTYQGLVIANVMQAIQLRPQMEGKMHAHCDACKTWIDATISDGQVVTIKASPATPDY